MPQWLAEGFQSWHDSKLFVERLTSVSHDALHVVAGTCVWLILALMLRRPVTSWLPLFGTVAVVVVNELVDLWVEIWPQPSMQGGEAAKDLLTTVAIPLLLFAAFRALPQLTVARANASRADGTKRSRGSST